MAMGDQSQPGRLPQTFFGPRDRSRAIAIAMAIAAGFILAGIPLINDPGPTITRSGIPHPVLGALCLVIAVPLLVRALVAALRPCPSLMLRPEGLVYTNNWGMAWCYPWTALKGVDVWSDKAPFEGLGDKDGLISGIILRFHDRPEHKLPLIAASGAEIREAIGHYLNQQLAA